MVNVIVVTEPPAEPVTLEDCYTHLRLTILDSPPAHEDDAWLTTAIKAAREYCEKATRRAFVTQTLRLILPAFPRYRVRFGGYDSDDFMCRPGYVELVQPPVQSIASVKYFDADNEEQTVSASDYFLTDDFVPRCQFKDTFVIPETYGRDDAVRVEYVAGYASADSPPGADKVPSAVKHAMLLLIGHWYANREVVNVGNITSALEFSVESLLAGLTVHRF